MFEAQLLIRNQWAQDDVELYSPWFGRGGNYLTATVDVVDFDGGKSNKIEVDVVTKKSEETGDGDVVGTAIAATGTGRFRNEYGPGVLEDLVRFRFTIPGGGAGDWVLFRMLGLVWFDAVEA